MYDFASGVETWMGMPALRSDQSIECIHPRGFDDRVYLYKSMQITAR